MTDIYDELRADNDRLRAALQFYADLKVLTDGGEVARRALERKGLRADNERLRSALQSLLTDPPATLDEPDTDAEVVIKMRAIARRALEPKP